MTITEDKVDLRALFTEGWIGRLRLKNRLVQAPMHTRYATDFGEVTERLIQYHVARARGGISFITLENTAVNWEEGRAAGNPVRIDDDRFITGLHNLVDAVHREGSLMATQLHHAGRQNMSSNIDGGGAPVAPSTVQSKVGGDPPREMSQDEIAAVVEEFREGARRSKAAGFDAVEIHGAHGYLLTQFLSPNVNLRTDEYGGSFENRARFPLAVVQAIREAVGPDFPIVYRISVEERTEGGMELEDGVAFCELIEPYVDAISVTAGIYESMSWIFTMQGTDPGSLLPLSKAVKAKVGVPVIGISRLGWALEDAARAIEAGELDFVAMARTQLADPDLPVKTQRGEHRRVRRCIACNECVGGFLFNGWSVRCVINPEAGSEHLLHEALGASRNPRRVLVIGGGPGGCEAARVAALRGHKVRLVERADALGGQLRASTAPAFKRREMQSLIDYYEAELAALGVDVALGTTATDVDRNAADVVLVATGTVGPPAPNDAVDAIEALAARTLPGDGPIVVLGSGETALNAAAFCVEQERPTTIVTGGEPLGADMNPLLAGQVEAYVRERGVQIADSPGAAGTPGSATLWAPARLDPDPAQAPGDGLSTFDVGTRARPGRLYEATQSGFWTAARL
ncbi:MAG: NAD-binding protein [Solirubrobacterales bacterium]|nr:NAD-binding protein [Solirubrobacterales bacterium]